MKHYADKHRIEREFQVGDEVYLKLQPYRQTSLALRKNLKLSSKFYGPYPVIDRIGPVAYKLKLPATSQLHPVFHVSLLKKKVGDKTVVSQAPPETDSNGHPLVFPAAVLDKRIVKRRNQAITQLLIVWSNLGPENATWEDYTVLKSQFPSFDPWGQGSVGEGSNVMMLPYTSGKMEAYTEEITIEAEKLEVGSYKDDMPAGRKKEIVVVRMETGAGNNEKNLPAGGIILEDE